MYANKNFKTKKALREAVAAGPVGCHQVGPFGPSVPDGPHCCEGPHFPKAHTWWAQVTVKDCQIVKVKS